MAVVNWAVHAQSAKGMDEKSTALELITFEPENFYSYISSVRQESNYLKCYAFIEVVKNCYIIRAPLDMELSYDRSKNWLSVNNISQDIYDRHFVFRTGEFGKNDPPLVTALPRYVFYSDLPVQMTILPLPFALGPNNASVVVGGFDISRWVRPIDWTFEFVDENKPISVKRGDPLFMVSFAPADGSKVSLNRVEYSFSVSKVIAACTSLKTYVLKVPLQKCYEMAEKFLPIWRRNNK